ncbi:hypothetical protein [Frigoribacterium sp. PvP032]|uniref:hypothetical protein n=1 Tax=Frigoribacterium sp. PvP032 TaxID=2806589 RepID=UPI001AE49B8A|nr:hypothetical protein [Frigoribacterium sp. PvP032]MBP1189566.1 hypothetical protein [Frigoribacterium sp. PvP032]
MTITPRAGRRLLRAAVALAAAGAVMLGLAVLLTWWTDLTAGGSARYSSVPQPDWSTVRLIAGNALTLGAGVLLATTLVVGVVGLVRLVRVRRPRRHDDVRRLPSDESPA